MLASSLPSPLLPLLLRCFPLLLSPPPRGFKGTLDSPVPSAAPYLRLPLDCPSCPPSPSPSAIISVGEAANIRLIDIGNSTITTPPPTLHRRPPHALLVGLLIAQFADTSLAIGGLDHACGALPTPNLFPSAVINCCPRRSITELAKYYELPLPPIRRPPITPLRGAWLRLERNKGYHTTSPSPLPPPTAAARTKRDHKSLVHKGCQHSNNSGYYILPLPPTRRPPIFPSCVALRRHLYCRTPPYLPPPPTASAGSDPEFKGCQQSNDSGYRIIPLPPTRRPPISPSRVALRRPSLYCRTLPHLPPPPTASAGARRGFKSFEFKGCLHSNDSGYYIIPSPPTRRPPIFPSCVALRRLVLYCRTPPYLPPSPTAPAGTRRDSEFKGCQQSNDRGYRIIPLPPTRRPPILPS